MDRRGRGDGNVRNRNAISKGSGKNGKLRDRFPGFPLPVISIADNGACFYIRRGSKSIVSCSNQFIVTGRKSGLR